MTKPMQRFVLCGSLPGNRAIVTVEIQDYENYQRRAKDFAEYAYDNLAGGFMDELFREYLKLSPHMRGRVLKMLAGYMRPA